MPKLVYVHEGIDYEKSTKKRKVLKIPGILEGIRNSEELWLEVSQYIDATYCIEKVETVYISGDGASWIKQGLQWVEKSKFVLDKYHLSKYVKVATAHLEDEDIEQEIDDALKEADKALLKKHLLKFLKRQNQRQRRKRLTMPKIYIKQLGWD